MYVATRHPLPADGARYVVVANDATTHARDEREALEVARAYWRRDVDATIRPLNLVISTLDALATPVV